MQPAGQSWLWGPSLHNCECLLKMLRRTGWLGAGRGCGITAGQAEEYRLLECAPAPGQAATRPQIACKWTFFLEEVLECRVLFCFFIFEMKT